MIKSYVRQLSRTPQIPAKVFLQKRLILLMIIVNLTGNESINWCY